MRRKGALYNGAKSNAQEDEKFKEKPGVKWNRESDDLRARPHPAKLSTCKSKLR